MNRFFTNKAFLWIMLIIIVSFVVIVLADNMNLRLQVDEVKTCLDYSMNYPEIMPTFCDKFIPLAQ